MVSPHAMLEAVVKGRFDGIVLTEASAAAAAAVCSVLTAVWPDWIEIGFRVDPDHHNGSIEWLITGALLVLAVVMGLLASHRVRSAHAEPRR